MNLIEKLESRGSLLLSEYKDLISNRELYAGIARETAVRLRKRIYKNHVYIRGLIEVGNDCVNDCYYCGIRRSNTLCERYKLDHDTILECCKKGYPLGFRTFVLQGGEGIGDTEEFCSVVRRIKAEFPDCAITLSLGELPFAEYKALYDAGADRYLLRHETADKEHYEKLHPADMSYDNRMRCLYDLKRIGFQTGVGFMVGSPYQTEETIAADLKFIEEFSPEMCGIGPFIPAKNTPFENEASGSAHLTAYLLSIIRIIKPDILLPATTALGTVSEDGRTLGILSGANVVMPNLSPVCERKKYSLYDNKASGGEEAAEGLEKLKLQMKNIGYEIVVSRGDILKGSIENGSLQS